MFSSALQLRAAGRLLEAEEMCRQLLAQNPRHADGLHLLALIRAQAGDVREAANLLERAVEANSNNAAVWLHLGDFRHMTGQRDQAAEAFRRAISIQSDLSEAHIGLGRVLAESGQMQAAEESFRRVLAVNPALTLLEGNWGGALHTSGLFLSCRPDSDRLFGMHPELRDLHAKWIADNPSNLGDVAKLYALMLNIKQVMAAGVPGHFAELGVFRGNSAAVLAHYARAFDRHTYLFDTFEGFDARDLKGIDAKRRESFEATSLEQVRPLVGDDHVRFIEGYFPDSLPADLDVETVAVVHVDCDLYEPFKAALAFFYPRLAPGGILILHDYSSGYFPGVKKAVDEFLAGIPEDLVLWPDKGGTAVLRKNRNTAAATAVL